MSFGVSDAMYGEEVNAAVILRPGQTATEEELEQYCPARLSAFEVPKRFFFMTSFPLPSRGQTTVTGSPPPLAYRASAASAGPADGLRNGAVDRPGSTAMPIAPRACWKLPGSRPGKWPACPRRHSHRAQPRSAYVFAASAQPNPATCQRPGSSPASGNAGTADSVETTGAGGDAAPRRGRRCLVDHEARRLSADRNMPATGPVKWLTWTR